MIIHKLLTSKKYAGRVREIVGTLSKYGLASWLADTKIEFFVRALKDDEGIKLTQFTMPQKLRKACEELGPAFIKLGQILSTRPDLLGNEIAKELAKLQDDTPSDNAEYIKETIKKELGKEAEELFAEFNYKPMASASIGQVHLATTFEGEKLAVKLLHKNIEAEINLDLEILEALAELAENHVNALGRMRITNLVKDFSRTIQKEINMNREANNIATFQENFKDNSHIIIPQVKHEFSTKRILTMKFEEGKSLNEIKNSIPEAKGKRLAEVGAEMYLNMIFRDNFYHGDPHPGNILVNADGKLVLLDFGMIGSLNTSIFNELEEFLIAIVNHDSESATESIYAICEVSDNVVKSELVNEIDYWIREYISQNVSNISTADAMADLHLLINKYQIVMPGNMALLFKVLVQLDGTARLLDPDFNVMDALKRFYVKMFKYRYSPKNVAKKILMQSREWYRVLRILPKALSRNLDALNEGELHLNLQHKGLENSVNRLVLGIIAASLFLGSVILWSLKVPPLLFGTSLFGMLGYVAAILLIYKLMRDIFKQPKK